MQICNCCTGQGVPRVLTEEQAERRIALFGILVSIFERAYILVYEPRMPKQTRRLWSSWEDYMAEWCRNEEFCAALPELLEGEDPDFRAHIQRIAATTCRRAEEEGDEPGGPLRSAECGVPRNSTEVGLWLAD